MAAVATTTFQPAVNTAPPSPTSSTSTTALAPRPVHLSASGLWKPTPTLTQNFSHPMPTPPASAAIPRSTRIPTPTSASASAKLPSLTTPTAALTPITPRSILKPGGIHPANRPPAYSPTTSSTSSSSPNYTPKSRLTSTTKPANKNPQRSRGKSIKEGAFFAFVLLPLSCWYTRGGKRLGSAGNGLGGEGKRNVIEWDGDEEEEEVLEHERRVRASPELRRPLYGRRDSLGQVGAGAGKPRVIVRRESFSASVPKGVTLGRGNAHARSNSFSSSGVRGRGGGAGMRMGVGMVRREVADYGVDRGAAAVDGEWDLERERERELEFERLRLSRAKSRTGSPVPLRRRSKV